METDPSTTIEALKGVGLIVVIYLIALLHAVKGEKRE